MKNIHILPTDKPSRLHSWTDEKGTRLELCDLEYSHTRNTQNIYITNSEEIKEGDWIYYTSAIGYCKTTLGGKGLEQEGIPAKKIILTTDQELISNGVQAIDDEFLNWFVINQSCEEVEVEPMLSNNGRVFYGYKIIIPKEEFVNPKVFSENGNELFFDKEGNLIKEDPKQERERGITITHVGKQETLEEAGTIAAGLCKHLEAKEQAMFIAGFQECIKWQQEQDKKRYSEEEVETIARDAYSMGRNNILIGVFNKWFKQYKKK